jgi:hypothetical protein
MASNSKKSADRAEAQFEKAKARDDAKDIALREKTERLKAIRLAKEAADKEAGIKKKPDDKTVRVARRR